MRQADVLFGAEPGIAKPMIQLTRQPIDTAALVAGVSSPAAGAVVLFLGTVREFTAGRRTVALDYECYPEMAEHELAKLEAEARRRWPLVEVAVVHRLGRLELAEASVAVAVSSAHRQEAFAAGQWLIDTLKQVVPIWKQENWDDGTQSWVHPGAPQALHASHEDCDSRARSSEHPARALPWQDASRSGGRS